MKFVHLTPQPNIKRIRRSGIRTGNGRRGKGVYAVPLMLLPQISGPRDNPLPSASPRSSASLWKWLAEGAHRHRHFAAIVFGDSVQHWPVDVYIELNPAIGTDWLTKLVGADVHITDENLRLARQAHQQGILVDIQITVRDAKSLGRVLYTFLQQGHKTWSVYDDTIEVILPRPIPACLIERIIPLYRTNKQFRQMQHQVR